MLTLRSRIGLTQSGLAEILGVSRRALSSWEAGSSYPKVEHLTSFIELAIEHKVFSDGQVKEGVRALWSKAHQKTLLDEFWLNTLWPDPGTLPKVPPDVVSRSNVRTAQVDWDNALVVRSFHGREWELGLLSEWIIDEHCRVVSVLGMGGIGKSAVAVSLMHRVAEQFDVVIWRSLRDTPGCDGFLDDLQQVLVPRGLNELNATSEQRQSNLLGAMRSLRILLVLDNFETMLKEGEGAGRLRSGYEDLGRFLRQCAETEHRSCVLLTSREKLLDLIAHEGNRAPVRALRLARLDIEACKEILIEKGVNGIDADRARLIDVYAGNPLALKIVGQTIVDLFDGEISPFLDQGEVVFGSIRDLFDEQFSRLSDLEQAVLYWLAILREPVTLDGLRAVLAIPIPGVRLLEMVERLHHHSLIENGQSRGSFTLQSVVLEYTTARLISLASVEIRDGKLACLIEFGLELAQAREYVRQTQERLLVTPILAGLRSLFILQTAVEEQLRSLLSHLAALPFDKQGYGPANMVALLRRLRGDLRGLDLSRLALRGAFLQGVEMQDTKLIGAVIRECVFTDTFDAIWSVAISRDGRYWGASIGRGEVCVWEANGINLNLLWQVQAKMIRALAFSPDGTRLAGGSLDGILQTWDVSSGLPVWSGWHSTNINNLAYAPDGSLLASAGNDATVRLWEPQGGTHLQTLAHPGPVFAVDWSPNSRLLASGDAEGCIRLWEVGGTNAATCIQKLLGHTHWIRGLSFTPTGNFLASGSYDGTVKVWDIVNGGMCITLTGHTDRVQTVAWSSDGNTLASSGLDRSIWLWDVAQSSARAVLQGHTAPVYGLAFMPESDHLISGSDDGTLRVWDVRRGQSERVIQGYTAALYDVDWSQSSAQIVSGGANAHVTIWDVAGMTPLQVIRRHNWLVYGVGWSHNGRYLASSGWDRTVRLWDSTTGDWVETRDSDTFFYGLAWSPEGERLACGTYLKGVLVWEVSTHTRRWIGREQPTRFPRVAWSPDGRRLAAGGDDGYVYIWDAIDGTLVERLGGHAGAIKCLAWLSGGARLVTAGSGSEGGEIFVWDTQNWECIQNIKSHPGIVHAVAWGPGEETLVSGGSDGILRWWDVLKGECLQVREAHQGTVQALRRSPEGRQLASCGDDGAIMLWNLKTGEHLQTLRRDRPYERLNITGIQGLTDVEKDRLVLLGALDHMTSGG